MINANQDYTTVNKPILEGSRNFNGAPLKKKERRMRNSKVKIFLRKGKTILRMSNLSF